MSHTSMEMNGLPLWQITNLNRKGKEYKMYQIAFGAALNRSMPLTISAPHLVRLSRLKGFS